MTANTKDIDARIDSAALSGLTFEERNERAEKYGIRNAGRVKLQLKRLRENGVLVDLYVGGTSMFSTATLWAELGVMDDTIKAHFTRGTKSLIPSVSAKLKSNETRLRQTLDKHSFDISGFRPWRLILWNVYETWTAEQERLVALREDIMQDVLENYDRYLNDAIENYTMMARVSWKSIVGQDYDSAIINGVPYLDEDSFVEAIIKAMLLKFPNRERIQSEIVAYYTTSLVYGEADVVADKLNADELRNKARLAEAESSAAREKVYLKNESLRNITRHEESLRRLEKHERELKIAAMRQAEIEKARVYLDKIGNPYIEIIKQMREQFAKDAESILKSIDKNGYVHGKIALKGRGLLDLYELLATHDDGELREKLEQLRSKIGIVGESITPHRNIDSIAQTLNEIKSLASATAEELTTVSREAFIEI